MNGIVLEMTDVEKAELVRDYLIAECCTSILIREVHNVTQGVQCRLLNHGVLWVSGRLLIGSIMLSYDKIDCYIIRSVERNGVQCLLMTYGVFGDYKSDETKKELTIDEFEGLLVDGYKSVVVNDYEYAMGLI